MTLYCRHTHESGFIALMSVLLISAILLAAVFTLSVSAFFSSFDSLDSKNKHESLALAQSCISAAALRLTQDPAYVTPAGGECVSVGGDCSGSDPQKVCTICSASRSGRSAKADLRALYSGAYTDLHVAFVFGGSSYQITDWHELPEGDPSCVVH